MCLQRFGEVREFRMRSRLLYVWSLPSGRLAGFPWRMTRAPQLSTLSVMLSINLITPKIFKTVQTSIFKFSLMVVDALPLPTSASKV
jgi:hypothetical protein